VSKDLKSQIEGLFSHIVPEPWIEKKDESLLEEAVWPTEISMAMLSKRQGPDVSTDSPQRLVEGPAPSPVEGLCPHLGLEEDRASHFSYPESAHRCFASGSPEHVELEHQERFCLSGEYRLCPRFAEATVPATRSDSARAVSARRVPPLDEVAGSSEEEPDDYGYGGQRLSPLRIALWAVTGVMTVLALFYLGFSLVNAPRAPGDTQGFDVTEGPSPTEPMAAAQAPTPMPLQLDRPTPIPTPPPGGNIFVLTPAAEAVGWVASNEEEGNHFGDSYLHAGIYGGFVYHGAIQFDPSSVITLGTPIYFAAVQVTGLSQERLGAGGRWKLQLLGLEIDPDWPSHSFSDIHNARIEQSIPPTLGNGDLDKNKINVFTFTAEQLTVLERRLYDSGPVSFRLDGPSAGENNLFTWDSGYGSGSLGNEPVLIIGVGPSPLTPVPTRTPFLVVITSTPTPSDVLVAAAQVATASFQATTTGTPTSLPTNWVTPIVVTSTPTPGNATTATYIAAWATIEALTIGTATATPPHQFTATPTHQLTATPTPTFVVVTSTPTPKNVLTAAAMVTTVTAQARAVGSTATPTPSNWVTPIVVTSTPTPENEATATYIAALITAEALATGTATPTPPNVFTATPTPILIYVDNPTLTPVPTPIPTPDPVRMPPELGGRIAFLSDREGGPGNQPAVWVMYPDGSNVARLTDPWAYEIALDLDTYSPDMSQQVLAYLYKNSHELWVRNTAHNWIWRLRAPPKGQAYHPAWSPDGLHIAYVSQEDGNDEIHAIEMRNGVAVSDVRLTQNDWEWDKHPSYSPDGRQIVFFSNRESGRRQIWIMAADGSQPRNISNNPYNDWDPVWIKWPGDVLEQRRKD
jgi:hypothetical protein